MDNTEKSQIMNIYPHATNNFFLSPGNKNDNGFRILCIYLFKLSTLSIKLSHILIGNHIRIFKKNVI